MSEKINVLFAASECVPFIKTGGLGDVAGSLPKALQDAGCEVRVILPKLGQIPSKYTEAMEPLITFEVPLGWRRLYCGIETLELDHVKYYFVDNEFYFKRDTAYGYGDDCERMAFFSKAILESLQYLPDFFPDVINCNDWHTAILPVLLHEQFMGIEKYQNIKTVFTIHNLKFQGICNEFNFTDLLALNGKQNAWDQLHFDRDCINFLQGALYYADYITTVSPTYAQEICTVPYGERLDHILNQHRDRLTGILNGIDTVKFAPEHALYPFTIDDFAGKAACKAALQREAGLPELPDVPLMVLISRLTDQKGLDLLAGCIDRLMEQDIQLFVLGTGDKHYEWLLGEFGKRYPDKMVLKAAFDEPLSMRMYAGADLFLMPSLFEPCGLSQMMSMSYGTLPVVRETGGLKDSVVPYNQFTGEGTGFSFNSTRADDLYNCIMYAISVYKDHPDIWKQLMKQAMTEDFSWGERAKSYIAVYEACLA